MASASPFTPGLSPESQPDSTGVKYTQSAGLGSLTGVRQRLREQTLVSGGWNLMPDFITCHGDPRIGSVTSMGLGFYICTKSIVIQPTPRG